MNGTITFESLTDLADFLKAFSGATATFNVTQENETWVLTFNGGY